MRVSRSPYLGREIIRATGRVSRSPYLGREIIRATVRVSRSPYLGRVLSELQGESVDLLIWEGKLSEQQGE